MKSPNSSAAGASAVVEGSGDHKVGLAAGKRSPPVVVEQTSIDAVPRSAGPWETLLYLAVFSGTYAYSAADFYDNIGKAPEKTCSSEYLKPGWLSKWMETAMRHMEDLILLEPTFLLAASAGFLFISQVSIRFAPRWVHYLATASYTLAATANLVGVRPTLHMLLMHCGAVCMGYFSLAGVWLLVFGLMLLQNSTYSVYMFRFMSLDYSQSTLFFPIMGYLYCRSISAGHSLNKMLRQQRLAATDEAPAPSLPRFLQLHLPRALAYGFYLPWHIAGPILTYPDFCREVEKPDRLVWDRKLLLLLLWRSFRLLVWLLLLQALHHFLPVGAYLHSIDSFSDEPYSRLVFSMYLYGQEFMLMYVQVYGWPGIVAKMDGVELPHWPDCISRVYTYRRMWRVFDRGLASFLHTHIYIPMGGSRRGVLRQVAAVVASFAFISVYHSDTNSIRAWAALNGLQLLLETGVCAVYEAKLKAWLCVHIGPTIHQRLVAFVIAANLILTTSFNFVFLLSGSVALQLIVELIVKPIRLQRPPWHLLFGFLLSYCSVQVSLRFEAMEARGKSKKDH